MRWCFLQGRQAPVANELVSTHWRHLIGQYVFKFPGGIPFVEDLEYFSTVDGEGKTMLWHPGGTIYPARVDLHDLVTTCPPEQGPGPDFSFFEEYVNFLQGLIDLFFSHFFTYWPDDSRRPGGVRDPCQSLTSCFARCREISESISGSDPSTLFSFIQYFRSFRSMPGHSLPGFSESVSSALLPFCPSADCPGRKGKTLEIVRETAAFLPVCLFVHRNRTLSSNTT